MARGPEAKFWKWLDSAMAGYWHAQRHEDKHSVGIPDISYALGFIDGWIELKAYDKWPNGKLSHYTPKQANWLTERGSHGSGNCFILMKIEKNVLLFRWQAAFVLLESQTETSLRHHAIAIWETQFDRKQFIKVITNGK